MRDFNMYERVYTRDEMGQANVVWFIFGGITGVVGLLITEFIAGWALGWI